MKLGGRVPVEPLDDERMTNIERRIVSGAADAAARPSGLRAPRWLGFAAAAMAAVAAGVIGWKLRGGAGDAPVVAEAPITISTEANHGTLAIGDATITSDPQTVFVVTRPDGGVLVDLTRGKVELEVAKRGNRPPLVVRAGDTDVIVVGTHFSVDYGDGTGEVDVRVTEGVVRVVRHHQEARVAKDQAWDTKRGVIALADARAVASSGGANATNDGGGERGTPIASNEPGATVGSNGYEIDMSKNPDILHGRTAQVPDGRTPVPNRTNSGAGSGAAKPEVPERTGSGGGATTSGRIDVKASIESQVMDPPMSVDETPQRSAVGVYQEIIVTKKGEEESRAYYGLAYTQALRIGRTDDALKTIDSYERRFAQGRVYPERLSMAWLKLRIVCKRGLGAQCRQAGEEYLKLAPGTDNPQRHVAELITLRP